MAVSHCIAILAAGGSTRMGPGRDKVTELVASGEAPGAGALPLLRVLALRALATGCKVIVCLPEDAHEHGPARRQALAGLEVTRLAVLDAAAGMGHSLAAAARAADGVHAPHMIVVLGDMPDVTTDDLNALISASTAHPTRVIRAVGLEANGAIRPGHPVVFPARLFHALKGLTGDAGAKSVISGEDVVDVPLPGHHAHTDLDTPEDWQKWRQKT